LAVVETRVARPGGIEDVGFVVVHDEGAGGDEDGLEAEEDEAGERHFGGRGRGGCVRELNSMAV